MCRFLISYSSCFHILRTLYYCTSLLIVHCPLLFREQHSCFILPIQRTLDRKHSKPKPRERRDSNMLKLSMAKTKQKFETKKNHTVICKVAMTHQSSSCVCERIKWCRHIWERCKYSHKHCYTVFYLLGLDSLAWSFWVYFRFRWFVTELLLNLQITSQTNITF